MSTQYIRGVLLGFIASLFFPFLAQAATITTPNFNYDVDYDNTSSYDCSNPQAGDNLDYFPTAQAQNAANALDNNNAASVGNPSGYHNGYGSFGFQSPDFDGASDEIFIWDCQGPCDSGNAPKDRINIPSTTYCLASERNLRRVMGHELFHHTQYSYITFNKWLNWGRTAIEGTARMMEDHIYSDIDGDSSLRYWSQVKNYLDNPNQDFWSASYSAALGWTYAAEQYGNLNAEPAIGVDFVREFWENAEDNNDSPNTPDTFDQTIKEFDNQSSAKEWFHDFSIANIAKELDVTGLIDAVKYRYKDENDGNGVSYSNVVRAWSGFIPGTQQANSSVTRWGARYFEANIQECSRGSILGFRAEGDLAAYSVIAVKNSDRVDSIIKGVTDDFAKAFIQPLSGDQYTRLIGVAAGRDDAANFEYTFDCAQGGLDIRRPDVTYPAYVGESSDPDKFLIRLVVTGPTSLGDPTVFGLQPEDFTVYVGPAGDPANEATVLTGSNVQGEYWLVAQAPTKAANGTFDLTVRLGDALADSEADAVRYEKLILDEVVVIDTSGSMGSPAGATKIEAAKNAASLFVDVLDSDDRIGLVSFNGDNSEPNDDAKLEEILADATDVHRNDVKSAISSLVDSGWTSIGDGLEKARDEFSLRGNALGEDWVILLSDGMENEANYWSNVEAAIKADGIRVESIALGPDTDQVLLQEIANETGGSYYYVDVGTAASSSLSFSSVTSSTPLANRLADTYALTSESIQRFERLWETDGSLTTPNSTQHLIEVGEGGIKQATFAFNWDDSAETLAVEIRRPDNSLVANGVAGARVYVTATHYVAHLPSLPAGTWRVDLQASAGSPNYKGILSGKDEQGASLDLYFAQYQNSSEANGVGAKFLRGLPQPILAVLVDKAGPVLNATVQANVEHPDLGINQIPLYDDGGHGDGNPNDGIYGNLYTRTTKASEPNLADSPGNGTRGSYNVEVVAQGKDNLGGTFARIAKGSFQVFEEREQPDFDGDGMPNRYENLHECLDASVNDKAKDPDEDRLQNEDEWVLGTDPCHPDTDRGGETDYSEVNRGANPFQPRDDIIPRPVDVEVVDWKLEHVPFPDGVELKPNANLIRYPLHTSYATINLWRATSAAGPFALIDTFDAYAERGLYMDTGLVNGVTYFYKIQPVDVSGNLATPSHVFSGTPSADPAAPIGGIEINKGATVTSSVNARLNLVGYGGVDEMIIANDISFSGSSWEPYDPLVGWTLQPDPSTGLATVYVRYRNTGNGKESTILQDSIIVSSDVGGIKGIATLSDSGGPFIMLVSVAGPSGVTPAMSDSDGVFNLVDMPAGVYDLQVSYDGYEPILIEGVEVNPGDTTEVGEFELVPLPAPAEEVVPALPLLAAWLMALGLMGVGSRFRLMRS